MELNIREAAALTGRRARTLRGQVARGEIPARRKGSRWVLDSRALPLTEHPLEFIEKVASRCFISEPA